MLDYLGQHNSYLLTYSPLMMANDTNQTRSEPSPLERLNLQTECITSGTFLHDTYLHSDLSTDRTETT